MMGTEVALLLLKSADLVLIIRVHLPYLLALFLSGYVTEYWAGRHLSIDSKPHYN